MPRIPEGKKAAYLLLSSETCALLKYYMFQRNLSSKSAVVDQAVRRFIKREMDADANLAAKIRRNVEEGAK